jgi:alpha-tubulin suppressor-like RCC1 family protein
VSGVTPSIGVTVGSRHACALRPTGSVECWGANDFGQLGNGSNAPSATAVNVTNLTDAVAVSAGDDHTCAERVDGSIRCWGRNDRGQLGDNSQIARNTSVVVQGVAASGPTYLSAGSLFNCTESGNTRLCWGANGSGQFGFGTIAASTLTADGRSSTGIRVGTGASHICSLTVDGRVFCSGANADGQLGQGTTDPQRNLVGVSSFDFNVEPAALTRSRSRIVEVVALAQCQDGAEVHLNVQLEQGEVTGVGRTTGRCTGFLERYPVVVPAQGRNGFVAGAAKAIAEARVMANGAVVDSPTWTRAVVLFETAD